MLSSAYCRIGAYAYSRAFCTTAGGSTVTSTTCQHLIRYDMILQGLLKCAVLYVGYSAVVGRSYCAWLPFARRITKRTDCHRRTCSVFFLIFLHAGEHTVPRMLLSSSRANIACSLSFFLSFSLSFSRAPLVCVVSHTVTDPTMCNYT
jgi:hypothetical protein